MSNSLKMQYLLTLSNIRNHRRRKKMTVLYLKLRLNRQNVKPLINKTYKKIYMFWNFKLTNEIQSNYTFCTGHVDNPREKNRLNIQSKLYLNYYKCQSLSQLNIIICLNLGGRFIESKLGSGSCGIGSATYQRRFNFLQPF